MSFVRIVRVPPFPFISRPFSSSFLLCVSQIQVSFYRILSLSLDWSSSNTTLHFPVLSMWSFGRFRKSLTISKWGGEGTASNVPYSVRKIFRGRQILAVTFHSSNILTLPHRKMTPQLLQHFFSGARLKGMVRRKTCINLKSQNLNHLTLPDFGAGILQYFKWSLI